MSVYPETIKALRRDLEKYFGLKLIGFSFSHKDDTEHNHLYLHFGRGLLPSSDSDSWQLSQDNARYSSTNFRYLMTALDKGLNVVEEGKIFWLRLSNCDWRIENANGIVGSKNLDFSETSSMIKSLYLIESKILNTIEFEPPYFDLAFKFTENLILRTFSIHTDDIVGNWIVGWSMDGKGQLHLPIRIGDQ